MHIPPSVNHLEETSEAIYPSFKPSKRALIASRILNGFGYVLIGGAMLALSAVAVTTFW